MPKFVEPQLAKLVEQPPGGAGWAHEVKFDGYRLQLRVEDGKATLRTRKGLDWTEKFAAIAAGGAKRLPDCMIDGEAVALDKARRAGFRRPAGRPLGGQVRATWSSSPSICCSPTARICARCRSSSARSG